MNMALDHAKSAAHPPVLFTLPQSPRPELKCKCNDIEYCSTCIDSPKAPVSWKDRLNKCFRFKRSLDDRHIYYLADDDDDETQYGYLDQFIEVLMMQAEQKAREERKKELIESKRGIDPKSPILMKKGKLIVDISYRAPIISEGLFSISKNRRKTKRPNRSSVSLRG
jgi:hypothetical protein